MNNKISFTNRIKKSFAAVTSISIGGFPSRIDGSLELSEIEETYSADIVRSNLLNNSLTFKGIRINKEFINESVSQIINSIDSDKTKLKFIGYDIKEKYFFALFYYTNDELIVWIPINSDGSKIRIMRREPVADNQKVRSKFIDLTSIVEEEYKWKNF